MSARVPGGRVVGVFGAVIIAVVVDADVDDYVGVDVHVNTGRGIRDGGMWERSLSLSPRQGRRGRLRAFALDGGTTAATPHVSICTAACTSYSIYAASLSLQYKSSAVVITLN